MHVTDTLTSLYKSAPRLRLDSHSKVAIISDCHRGDGSNADDYMKNQNIAFHALTRYYNEGYTYIELGDGDEMWENRNFRDISYSHGNTLELIKRFFDEGRLYMVYGNHDMCKSQEAWAKKNLNSYMRKNCRKPLFPGIQIHEALVLEYESKDNPLLLLHGHQVDPLNYTFWRLARFLVRYIWRPLELLGVRDPFSAGSNHKKKKKVETKLTD